MNIIQTLWCGNRKLTESQFWWSHAEYNLMSWTLSCHSLREHFEKVTLYTDTEGARILIDTLRLPYSEVIVNFDGFDCLTCHWALAKVRAYSLQSAPFLHIDGDIYLPQPLPQNALGGALTAQNKEYCSEYYKGMIRRFLAVDNLKLAPKFAEALRQDDVPSYNLGFCGGNDTEFFGEFCEEVERFFKDNDFNGERFRNADISANVVYEQMFFSIMARDKGFEVSTIYPGTIRDNGYRADDFCDLSHYEQRQFIHVLGGHKRTQATCGMVERTLLRKYPEAYERIAALFPERHRRLCGTAVSIPAENATAGYRNFLKSAEEYWHAITSRDLLIQERKTAGNTVFSNSSDAQRQSFILKRNPYARIYGIPDNERETLRRRLNTGDDCRDIAVVPSVSGKGLEEYPLDNMTYNIVCLLDEPTSFAELSRYIASHFREIPEEAIRLCIEKETETLLEHGMITAQKSSKDYL